MNGSLDYETETWYTFTVFAKESSTSESWKANCTVTVILSDVNEYDPKFTQGSYHAVIEENKAAGFEVITVSLSLLTTTSSPPCLMLGMSVVTGRWPYELAGGGIGISTKWTCFLLIPFVKKSHLMGSIFLFVYVVVLP